MGNLENTGKQYQCNTRDTINNNFGKSETHTKRMENRKEKHRNTKETQNKMGGPCFETQQIPCKSK